MKEMIAIGGRILGWAVFFFLLMRGLLAVALDFTEWTLRRQRFESDDPHDDALTRIH